MLPPTTYVVRIHELAIRPRLVSRDELLCSRELLSLRSTLVRHGLIGEVADGCMRQLGGAFIHECSNCPYSADELRLQGLAVE